MNITNYHIKLSHEYEYKHHCSEMSSQIFEVALKEKLYPSRFDLLSNLIQETVYAPFYFMRRTAEIAIYTSNLLRSERSMDCSGIRALNLKDVASLLTLQILIPLVCTAIRLCATVSGLLIPYYALRGWKLAEGGEEYAYLIWMQHFDLTEIPSHNQTQAHEEVDPHHAIFYLGQQQAYKLVHLDGEEDHTYLNDQISQTFSSLLYEIFLSNPECFRQLLNVGSSSKDLAPLPKKNKVCHFISHDTKEILTKLKQDLKDKEIEDSHIDSRLLVEIPNLPTKACQRVFEHIYLNLQNSLLENDLSLDCPVIEQHMMLLKDLFSRRFKFGRVHFPQSIHSFGLYTRI